MALWMPFTGITPNRSPALPFWRLILTGRRCMVVISVGKTCTVSIRCECNKQYVRLVRGCINGTPRKERGHSSELSETVKRRFRTSKTLGVFTTTAIFRKFVALKVWTFWEWRVRLARALVLLPVLYQQILTLASSFATSQQMRETLVLTNQWFVQKMRLSKFHAVNTCMRSHIFLHENYLWNTGHNVNLESASNSTTGLVKAREKKRYLIAFSHVEMLLCFFLQAAAWVETPLVSWTKGQGRCGRIQQFGCTSIYDKNMQEEHLYKPKNPHIGTKCRENHPLIRGGQTPTWYIVKSR